MISVVIPCYNQEKYIAKNLDSLVFHNEIFNEIIVIDDGSTDNSKEIVLEYSNKYPNIKLYSQTNQGVSSARNNGFEKISNQFVLFLDGDDYIEIIDIIEIKRLLIESKGSEIILFDFISDNDSITSNLNNLSKGLYNGFEIIVDWRYSIKKRCFKRY